MKRYRHIEQPIPERNLHHAENTNNDKIRMNAFWKLLSRITQELFELWQFLPNKYDRPCHLRPEQEQIGRIFARSLPLFDFINQ